MKSQRSFEVVRASAGSGKTYRLVSRYLACCLAHDDPRSFRHILALTFTNKAAWEMKERILSDLANVGSGKASDAFVNELADQTSLTPEVLASRARALRATMLHRYGEMAVMTLDSFTNRLVKSFARDLALDQDYRIELDQDRIVDEAVGNLLDRMACRAKKLTELLKGFARLQVEEEKTVEFGTPHVVRQGGAQRRHACAGSVGRHDARGFQRLVEGDSRRGQAGGEELAARATKALEAVRREGLTKDVSAGPDHMARKEPSRRSGCADADAGDHV